MSALGELHLVYVLARFPCRSERFIAREIEGLVALGARIEVLVIGAPAHDPEPAASGLTVWRRPSWSSPRAWAMAFTAALFRPRATLRALRLGAHFAVRDGHGRLSGLRTGLLAAVLAARFAKRHPHVLHAHFGNDPATVAAVIGDLLGCPWGFSVHAHDIWAERLDLAGKAARARHVLCCSTAAADDVRARVGRGDVGKVQALYHGIDLDRWRPDDTPVASIPTILAAGRLVPKKGFATLVDACASLRAIGCDFRCRIVGDGPEHKQLAAQTTAAGLDDRVELRPWMGPEQLAREMATAWLVVVPSVVTTDGDRDNVPNVLVEALAMARFVVASDLPGIAEVLAASSGVLVPPGDGNALAAAIRSAIAHGGRPSETGRQTARKHFDLERNARLLAAILLASAGMPVQYGRQATPSC